MFALYGLLARVVVFLTDLLTPDRIRVPMQATDKAGVLAELLDVAVGRGQPGYVDIFRAVEERERVLSTGIGHGVAIPHGKSARLQELRLAAGATSAPVAFDALDGQPVRLFFLLVGPEQAGGHEVKALGRISRLVRSAGLRDRLVSAANADEFHRLLAAAERQVA